MTNIIDRRDDNTKSAPNRQKFIERYKHVLKDNLKNATHDKSISDIKDGNIDISINRKSIKEPHIHKDQDTGTSRRVITGNKQKYQRGQKIRKPPEGHGRGQGGDDELENYQMTLSKDEFISLFFDDLELPNFIKETINKSQKIKIQRSGWKNEGVPPQLDIKKTYMQYFMRTSTSGDEDEWIEDIDLRYRQYVQLPNPDKTAVIIFIMDTSGSMGEELQYLCKQFFMLLYLFIEHNYDNVKCEFIRYTETAKHCTEEEFFNNHETGGTLISQALILANEIIDTTYPPESNNIYIAHGADSESGNDHDLAMHELNRLFTKVQYYAYLHVGRRDPDYEAFSRRVATYAAKKENVGFAIAKESRNECYEALKKLFAKASAD